MKTRYLSIAALLIAGTAHAQSVRIANQGDALSMAQRADNFMPFASIRIQAAASP